MGEEAGRGETATTWSEGDRFLIFILATVVSPTLVSGNSMVLDSRVTPPTNFLAAAGAGLAWPVAAWESATASPLRVTSVGAEESPPCTGAAVRARVAAWVPGAPGR